jgi:cyclic beta-1,2-glucan synthetase
VHPQHLARLRDRFRYHTATYEIVVENPHAVSRGVVSAELDGEPLADSASVPLQDDGATHKLRVVLGNRTN